MGQVAGGPDQQVDLPIRIAAVGFPAKGLELRLTYNFSRLERVSEVAGGGVPRRMGVTENDPAKLTSTVTYAVGVASGDVLPQTGVLFSVRFKLLGTEPATTVVSAQLVSAVDGAGRSAVLVVGNPGSIAIQMATPTPTLTPTRTATRTFTYTPTSTLTPTPSQTPTPDLAGDANKDGRVDAMDLAVLPHLLFPGDIEGNSRADGNRDNHLTAADVRWLVRRLAIGAPGQH